MTTQLLIDASHSDETRAVIISDDRLQDYEVETSGKEQIKGNIYIGEVTRVEPSLQAAFINYGGNRNGFLAFSEVHPSYFDLPEEEKAELAQELEELAARRRGEDENEEDSEREESSENSEEEDSEKTEEELSEEDARAIAIAAQMADDEGAPTLDPNKQMPKRHGNKKEEVKEEKGKRQAPIHRRYKIEDVLKSGQKITIQVVKEERGTKGAALTTYFSLPGRYTVLMPNTPYAGGISRKITGFDARKELKEAVDSLQIPNDMGLIVRTAGVGQGKEKIQNDYKNLTSLWKKIQENQKDGEAGACVHEDGSLSIRSLRDMYNEEVDEIIISGRRAYRAAKDFAKTLMPDLSKIIKEYRSTTEPIFIKHGVEQELAEMYRPRVDLPSGGYIIINPTEALVSIDVNSGRATQHKNLEDTALKTNLEAAEEIARQLRLRDLSGLIVVDFIDMEYRRNNYTLEKAVRKFMRKDRARVQISGLSDFGLIEISRQRLRPSLVESTLQRCPHCHGAGWVPTLSSAALMIIRSLEAEDIRSNADRIIVSASTELVIYILNHKKDLIKDLEAKYKFQVLMHADDSYIAPDYKLDLVLIKSDGTESVTSREILLRENPDDVIEAQRSRSNRGGKNNRRREKPENNDKSDDDKDRKSSRSRKRPDRKSSDEKPAKKSSKTSQKADDKAETEQSEEKQAQPIKSRGRRPRKSGKFAAKPVIEVTEDETSEHTHETDASNADTPAEAPKPITRGGRRRMVKAAIPQIKEEDIPEVEEIIAPEEEAVAEDTQEETEEVATPSRGRKPSLAGRLGNLFK